MKITSANFINAYISDRHAHEISFFIPLTQDQEADPVREEVLDTDNAYYVIFAGDPTITYDVTSLDTEECKRLRKLTSAQNVKLVRTSANTITLDTEFSGNTNILIDYTSNWVSSVGSYNIMTNNQACVVGQYCVDRENSTFVSAKYCILDHGSCNLNISNEAVIVAEGDITINDETYPGRVILEGVSGPLVISSDKSYVFILEYSKQS